ncbi:MAG: sigma-70 family RNA polymerase sigma factor [Acidobacteria bacterium]|nr:sigma-70 family RNA polymerase sigma factor [Acidobacteriota bacterium]MBV9070139.1 sigma-70 family RNA polymerase sigma factor [Acidobacteriota bacterium]MBV9186314.1 sigma-70 family RNA polymerase sigma factor [Acidobacteriota bacterium]
MARRVLIVDDEEAIVEGLLSLLECEEIESNGAFDRLGAELLMEETFYSVIVADLRLHTEAEGLELLDAIRRISPRSRVLTLTGFATFELEEEVLRRGSTQVMRKPAPAEAILGAIADLLAEVEKMAAEQEPLDLEQLHVGMRKLLHSIPRKRYGLSADEAEEVVQQAWLLFLEKRELIRTARPWLIGTVANLCKRQIGASMRRRETFVSDDVLAELPDTDIESYDDNIALRQALDSLSEESRTLCILIAIKGYAYDEVSAITGLPLGSIGPMYLRAKSKMRMQLAA